jgi:hypothetical protein
MMGFGFLPLAYTPFAHPLPGGWEVWPLWLLPLCAAVAIVYKSIKCRAMRQVPRQATQTFLWIVIGMMVAAGILLALMKVLEWE